MLSAHILNFKSTNTWKYTNVLVHWVSKQLNEGQCKVAQHKWENICHETQSLEVPELGKQDIDSQGRQKEQAGHKKAYAVNIMKCPAFIFKLVYTDESHC